MGPEATCLTPVITKHGRSEEPGNPNWPHWLVPIAQSSPCVTPDDTVRLAGLLVAEPALLLTTTE